MKIDRFESVRSVGVCFARNVDVVMRPDRIHEQGDGLDELWKAENARGSGENERVNEFSQKESQRREPFSQAIGHPFVLLTRRLAGEQFHPASRMKR